MRHICTLSGGKASAFCAEWAINKYGKENIVLYFNDTGWEHPDLHRFLNDLAERWSMSIINDSDGRNPEEVFYDKNFLGNNRVPLCSRILKADRLQKYFEDGDNLIFGIGPEEQHRAVRLEQVYQTVSAKRRKSCTLEFPLIANQITKEQVQEWMESTGIEIPLLYRLGFEHNNCSGGCVRAGKKHWAHLLQVLPEVYKERERVEEEFRAFTGTDVHIFKDETLKQYRERIEAKDRNALIFAPEDSAPVECIGICNLEN